MCVFRLGFTLVITPLVSLMEDQVMYLKSVGVSAVMLNASSSKVTTSTSQNANQSRFVSVVTRLNVI